MNWLEYSLSTIVNDRELFTIFLREVKEKLGVSQPNGGCNKCLNDYLTQLQNKLKPKVMSKSSYKLLAKREGVQLEFGSAVHVTNDNLTDEYAEVLIKKFKEANADFKLGDLFEVYPTENQKTEKVEKTKKASKK